MRKPLGIGAVVLGFLGVLLCAAFVGVGWWVAGRSVERIGRVTGRVEQGLAEADERLGRVESRVAAVRTELNEVRTAAEAVVAENRELPRLQAGFEQLFDRLLPAIDRAETIADSLRTVAASLRAAADVVDQLNDDLEATVRVRNAAGTIDQAAEELASLRARAEAAKSAKSAELSGELVTLARQSAAGSERLGTGLAAARQEIAAVRGRTREWRDKLAFWVYAAATANTLVWVWGGLGQLCMIGWGRGRRSNG